MVSREMVLPKSVDVEVGRGGPRPGLGHCEGSQAAWHRAGHCSPGDNDSPGLAEVALHAAECPQVSRGRRAWVLGKLELGFGAVKGAVWLPGS